MMVYFVAVWHLCSSGYSVSFSEGLACPQVADGGTASDMEGSCE
jgi:hypothetical protein